MVSGISSNKSSEDSLGPARLQKVFEKAKADHENSLMETPNVFREDLKDWPNPAASQHSLHNSGGGLRSLNEESAKSLLSGNLDFMKQQKHFFRSQENPDTHRNDLAESDAGENGSFFSKKS